MRDSWRMHRVSWLMRQAMVEAAGFEVFDAFGVTLHAPAEWFDDVRYGVKYKLHEAEALSDVVTQLLLNQLCNPG